MKQKAALTGATDIPFLDSSDDPETIFSYFNSGSYDAIDRLNKDDLHQMIRCIIAHMTAFMCTRCQKALLRTLVNGLPDNSNWLFDNCADTFFPNWWDSCECETRAKEKDLPKMHMKLYHSSSPTKKVVAFTEGMAKSKGDIEHLARQLTDCRNSFEQLSREHSMLQIKCEKQDLVVAKMKARQDTTEENLTTLQQAVEDLHYSTNDGSFMWRIEHVAQKLDDARSERQTSIYSPAFYSSPTGYKMRARMDMSHVGDGGTPCVSVALVLLQGEHDALLKWPFPHPATFRLYDQTGRESHIDNSITPETEPSDLQKPAGDRNIVYEIPNFCPRAVIEQPANSYIRDDRMYLKVAVDFDGHSKVLLPYTIDDDLDLPTHRQDDIARRRVQEMMHVREQFAAAGQREDQDLVNLALLPQHIENSSVFM